MLDRIGGAEEAHYNGSNVMKAWTVPEEVSAIRWHPQLGILPGTQGMGCWQCGLNPCASAAHHEPIAHPHHLEIQTWRGPAMLFSGDYLIAYRDGRRERVTAVEYAQRFSETPLVRQATRDDAIQAPDRGYSLSAAESVTVTVGQKPE